MFFALLVLRVPVAFALGLACLPILRHRAAPRSMQLVQETFNAYNSFILLAVPFFLLTANLMNVGGITDRLVRLSRTMVGHFPGGAGADQRAAVGVLRRHLRLLHRGRREPVEDLHRGAGQGRLRPVSFSVAITAVSAVLAVIIPPSILMIVWGGVISTSIGALYLAGIMPGLLIALAQMATVHVYAKIYQLSGLSARHAEGVLRLRLAVAAGAVDAVHHRRRHPARLVHRHRVGGHRGDLRRGAVASSSTARWT